MPDGVNGTGSALGLQCSFSSWFVYIGLFLSKQSLYRMQDSLTLIRCMGIIQVHREGGCMEKRFITLIVAIIMAAVILLPALASEDFPRPTGGALHLRASRTSTRAPGRYKAAPGCFTGRRRGVLQSTHQGRQGRLHDEGILTGGKRPAPMEVTPAPEPRQIPAGSRLWRAGLIPTSP